MRIAETYTPLRARPARSSSGSLEENIRKQYDRAAPHFYWVAIILSYVLMEWLRYYHNIPPYPYGATIAGLLLAGWSVYRLVVYKRTIERLKLERHGEKIVAEGLNQLLMEKDTRIFHNITGEGFNIDQVVLSPHGIFVLDMVAYPSPSKGAANISLRYGRVYANGVEIEPNPAESVAALARRVADLLEASTGRRYTVQPVVLVPDWQVDPLDGMPEVLVLNPKSLPKFVESCPHALNLAELRLAAYNLSGYIRAD